MKTLEKEFAARVFIHKLAVAHAYVQDIYVKQELQKGGVLLSTPTIQQQAEQRANTLISSAMQNGSFDYLYNKAWEHIGDRLPEYMNVMNLAQ